VSKQSKIAIVGGGLSGLIAAQKLKDSFEVPISEKARGVGGRMSTRRADPYQFDHGAQYFTARSKTFQTFLKSHIATGLVQEWPAKILTLEKNKKPYKRDWFEPHYVCTPGMSSLCKYLARDISCVFSAEITAMERNNNQWNLVDKSGIRYENFDWVIVTAPSHQAASLLPSDFKDIESIKDVQMTGCYSVMLGFENLPKLNWDVAIPKGSLIGWMAVNSLKPARASAPSIIVQTTNEWADHYMDEDMEAMGEIIIQEFCDLSGISLNNIAHSATHRWKYANTLMPANQPFFLDADQKIGVCGDWCIEGRVESAFLSADSISNALSNCCLL